MSAEPDEVGSDLDLDVKALWRPQAELSTLQARAELLARLRAFFLHRGLLEVETPLMSGYANVDPAIDSIPVSYSGPSARAGHWLHTSPEFAMKRLLAAGSGPIYQICKVFRDGEEGRLHNPEFTLLEWYRPGFDEFHLMEEVADLVDQVADRRHRRERFSYAELFERHLQLDPHAATVPELQQVAQSHGIDLQGAQLEASAWLDLLMSHLIEPHLGRGCLSFVHDYPASQASLARVQERAGRSLACRFELYMEGVEIANGFHELTDAQEQKRRFQADSRLRQQRARPPLPWDEHLIDALTHGLPDCSGVALGVDRLLMVLQGLDTLKQTLAFPIDRA